MIFIFDVDGTLTPSRSEIDPHFHKWFTRWVAHQQTQHNKVWLISGSDYPKTVEQLGQDLVDSVDRCYNCMGNTLYMDGNIQVINEFKLSDKLRTYLTGQLEISPYPHRYGQHIEERPGMVNFSIVGRGAVGSQRTDYYKWDNVNKEREHLAADITAIFKSDEVVALVGGETGLDITRKGWDKGQIISEIHEPVAFFGDKMQPGENDYPLRKALEQHNSGFRHKSHQVSGWIETMAIISEFM